MESVSFKKKIKKLQGPEISEATIKILDAAGANIHFERHEIGIPIKGSKELVSKEAIDSVLKNKLAIKGPLATPVSFLKFLT
jgi:isocitrate/isopropylmalate dehydrogenase